MGKQILTHLAHLASSHSFFKVYSHAIFCKRDALFIVPWWSPPCEVYSASASHIRQKMSGSGIRSGVGGERPGSALWEMADLYTWVLSRYQLGDLPLHFLPFLLTLLLLLVIMSFTTVFLNNSAFGQEVWCLSFRTFLIWDAERKKQKDQHYLVQHSGGKFEGLEVWSTRIRTM